MISVSSHVILAATARGGLPLFLRGRQATGRDAAATRRCGLRDGVVSADASEDGRGVENSIRGLMQADLY